jgi:hypothetical protein
MYVVELVGGPQDGERRQLGVLTAVIEYEEPRRDTPPLGPRLEAGERILASEVENYGLIVHRYGRTERKINGAWVYEYLT